MKNIRFLSILLVFVFLISAAGCAANVTPENDETKSAAAPETAPETASGAEETTPPPQSEEEPSSPATEADDPTSEESPEQKLTLKQRLALHDPDVEESHLILMNNSLDVMLESADFMVLAKYVGRKAKDHKYKFEIVKVYNAKDDVHEGDVLLTASEPYDVILTDAVTGEKEYLYFSPLKGSYKTGEEYVLPGVYLDNVPTLFYGFYAPANDLRSGYNYDFPLFDALGNQPASAFQPDENTTAQEFIDYCLGVIENAKNK